MSFKKVDREVTIMMPVYVYACDGPTCSRTLDTPALRSDEAPPGWIFTNAVSSTDPATAGNVSHYCSRDCLLDSLVP